MTPSKNQDRYWTNIPRNSYCNILVHFECTYTDNAINRGRAFVVVLLYNNLFRISFITIKGRGKGT